MIKPGDIHPLTEFQRTIKTSIARLRKSCRPELLTVNGKAAIVVQDAESYFRTLTELEDRLTHEAVQVGLEQMEAGKVKPLDEVMKQLRTRRGLRSRMKKSA